MYAIKIGEQNNREVVAYSNNKRFTTANVNYLDNVIQKYPNTEIVESNSVKTKLLNVGYAI